MLRRSPLVTEVTAVTAGYIEVTPKSLCAHVHACTMLVQYYNTDMTVLTRSPLVTEAT